jgi:hypothetical protein
MIEGGVPFSVVATIMGWSPSTAVRMARRYGHIGQAAQREAVKHLNGADSTAGGAQNWAQFQADRFVASTNSLRELAPRPGLEPGIRRGELTARDQVRSDPISPLACLQFSLLAHGGRACRESFLVNKPPRAWVSFRVKGQSAGRIIVLFEATRKIAGLTHITLALWIQKHVNKVRHENWLLGQDSNLEPFG